MSKSANKMSVLQLSILTAVNMMGSGIIMKAVEAGTGGRTLYRFLACHGCRLHGLGLRLCQGRHVQ